MALGTPCIVSDCDGNRDLITNDFNGYLVEENNTADFTAKCIKLWNEEKIQSVFSKNTKKSFEQEYNILKKIVNLETIYLKQSNLKYKKSHK
jgi:glycosyltransferase involved in cell wall biosynthesis